MATRSWPRASSWASQLLRWRGRAICASARWRSRCRARSTRRVASCWTRRCSSLRDVPMVEVAQRGTRPSRHLLHDVKAAAFGELMAGAGIGQADVAYLNLGTGLSMAFVFGWQRPPGAAGTAGEIGHVIAEPDGEHVQLRPARLPRDDRVRTGDRAACGPCRRPARGRLPTRPRRRRCRLASAAFERGRGPSRPGCCADFVMVLDIRC